MSELRPPCRKHVRYVQCAESMQQGLTSRATLRRRRPNAPCRVHSGDTHNSLQWFFAHTRTVFSGDISKGSTIVILMKQKRDPLIMISGFDSYFCTCALHLTQTGPKPCSPSSLARMRLGTGRPRPSAMAAAAWRSTCRRVTAPSASA